MFGNSADYHEGPGNPYPHIAARLEKELAEANGNLVELQKKQRYSFASEEELVGSAFFQRALSKSLEFKDRQILSLQQELLNIAAQAAMQGEPNA